MAKLPCGQLVMQKMLVAKMLTVEIPDTLADNVE